MPLGDRPLVVVNSEAIEEQGNEPLGYAGIVDISDETNASPDFAVSSAGPASRTWAYAIFTSDPAGSVRTTSISRNTRTSFIINENLVFLTYFNAGLRIYDISDERTPREVGFFSRRTRWSGAGCCRLRAS